jgi:hypothetical protein
VSHGAGSAGRRAAVLPGLALLVGGLALLALACAQSTHDPRRPGVHPPPRAAAQAPVIAPARPVRSRDRRPRRPVRVTIPAIGVDAPVIPLGLDADRALEVPERFDVAGWWSGGARPGERGPAVIVAHVDSYTGPAVFFRLRSLRPGARIVVADRAGRRRRFVVQRVAEYSKAAFPTRRVYGTTARPTLRLITCSGAFDRSTGHYVDNTVVFARA